MHIVGICALVLFSIDSGAELRWYRTHEPSFYIRCETRWSDGKVVSHYGPYEPDGLIA